LLLINPKGFLWCGEDNTSPQIKKMSGKNVDGYEPATLRKRLRKYCWQVQLFFAPAEYSSLHQKYCNYRTGLNK